MDKELDRRKFIKAAGFTSCALLLASVLNPIKAINNTTNKIEIPDPKKLNYCGYKCPADCEMLKSTLENDIKLKLKAYNDFRIKETYGEEFDEKKVFCWGCKTPDKPEGILISNCKVKKCVLDKGLSCCIECNTLEKCEKELWTRFPEHYNKVKEMQRIFMDSKNN